MDTEQFQQNKQKELGRFWQHKTNFYILWIITILFLVVGFWFLSNSLPRLTCDNYFMFVKSEEFLKNGFFHTDHLSMHKGLHCVFPQWLFAVPLTMFKDTFGIESLYIIGVVLYAIVAGCLILSNIFIGHRSPLGWMIVAISFSYICMFTGKIRPYLLSAVIIALTYLCLEKYVRGNCWKYLLPLPILSVILINIHNSLYIGLFLPFACFIGEWVLEKLLSQLQTRWQTSPTQTSRPSKWQSSLISFFPITSPVFSITPILAFIPLCLLTSLINPYGLEYVTYFIPSMDAVKPLITQEIGELQSLFASQNQGVLFLSGAFLLFEIYFILKNWKGIPYRHLFSFFGFLFMFCVYERNAILFFTCGQMAVLYACSLYVLPSNLEKGSRVFSSLVLMVCTIVAICSTFVLQTGIKKDDGMHVYPAIDRIAEKMQNEYKGSYSTNDGRIDSKKHEAMVKEMGYSQKDTKDRSIFITHQYAGSYAAYNGLKPYIDACAENYGIAINGKADIAEEYISMPIEEKIKKYEFKYVVVMVGENAGVPKYDGYKVIYNKKESNSTLKWRVVAYERED